MFNPAKVNYEPLFVKKEYFNYVNGSGTLYSRGYINTISIKNAKKIKKFSDDNFTDKINKHNRLEDGDVIALHSNFLPNYIFNEFVKQDLNVRLVNTISVANTLIVNANSLYVNINNQNLYQDDGKLVSYSNYYGLRMKPSGTPINFSYIDMHGWTKNKAIVFTNYDTIMSRNVKIVYDHVVLGQVMENGIKPSDDDIQFIKEQLSSSDKSMVVLGLESIVLYDFTGLNALKLYRLLSNANNNIIRHSLSNRVIVKAYHSYINDRLDIKIGIHYSDILQANSPNVERIIQLYNSYGSKLLKENETKKILGLKITDENITEEINEEVRIVIDSTLASHITTLIGNGIVVNHIDYSFK